MKKLTILAAALAAAGVALYTTTVLAQPAPAEAPALAQLAPVDLDRAPGDAVERHMGALLRQKLADLREERAWALGLR